MSGTKEISLFLVIIALFGLWLNSKSQLQPFLAALTTPTNSGPSNGPSLPEFAIAAVVYLFCLTLMSSKTGFWFTLTLVLGALGYNLQVNKNNPNNQLVNLLDGTAFNGFTSSAPITTATQSSANPNDPATISSLGSQIQSLANLGALGTLVGLA